jgi:nucleotidyltransferase substrate binding protein (TIGR01987 family)
LNKKHLSFTALAKALASLERAIKQPKNEFSRDSVIQRFEYTFELCWKSLQKVLESDRQLEDSSVRGILREAARTNWIQNTELWFRFQEARNLTSHTYNEETAEEVYQTAILLPKEASALLRLLEQKVASA